MTEDEKARGKELFPMFMAYANLNKTTPEIKAMVEVYATLTLDIPIEGLRVAIAKCIQELKFLPTVAELRKAATAAPYRVAREDRGSPYPYELRLGDRDYTILAPGIFQWHAAKSKDEG